MNNIVILQCFLCFEIFSFSRFFCFISTKWYKQFSLVLKKTRILETIWNIIKIDLLNWHVEVCKLALYYNFSSPPVKFKMMMGSAYQKWSDFLLTNGDKESEECEIILTWVQFFASSASFHTTTSLSNL